MATVGEINALKLHLKTELDDEINHQFSKGRILSTADVTYFLDHCLEVYEDEHGDVFPEKEFEAYVDSVIADLIVDGQCYIAGDRDSYKSTVRDYGLTSLQEARMCKIIAKYNRESKSGNKPHATVWRDTEFPYDATGKYII